MHRRVPTASALALVAIISTTSGALAELALSANDGKAVLVDGVNTVPASPPADYVAVIDLGASPPKVVAEIPAPTSIVGPPSSVAIARNESFALVTAATKLNPADPKKTVPDDTLTVIDLKSSPPKVLATLKAGQGAAGVSINRQGTLALVANRAEGTVSVFSIAGNTLTEVGKVALGDAKSGPSHVAFAPDGKTALVTRDGAYAAVSLQNGTNKAKNSPFFNDHGLVKILSVQPNQLVPLTEAKAGGWCQGLAWSRNGRTLLVQCQVEKEILLFNFDGKELKAAGSIKLNAGPVAIRTAH